MRRVVCVQERLLRYRVPLFEHVRENLRENGVAFDVCHGTPSTRLAERGDSADLPWSTRVRNQYWRLGASHEAVWQRVMGITRNADLVLVDQASRLLVNYLLLARQSAGGPRVALWGHGMNLQYDGSSLSRLAEAAKRGYSRRPHWWFAYTEGTARRVTDLGYPADRITVLNNTVDTMSLRAWYESVTAEELRHARVELGLRNRRVCLCLGSLYKDKRIHFLLEAGELVAAKRPDFALLIVGSGPDQQVVERAAAGSRWLRHVPVRFGREKAVLARACELMLLPGAVGLAILDAFAFRLPLVTTREGKHGPEIEYLRDGENGVMLPPGSPVEAYADEILRLLDDEEYMSRLRTGAASSAEAHSIEEMAQRFTEGITAALTRRDHHVGA